jgi:GntR family phosphonate transport system transcriptional regulator
MTTTLDLEKAAPRYARISGILADEIKRLYKPGDKLPPEQVLANRFAVNRHTLRRAVDELVKVGLVERRWGVGVFVLEPCGDESRAVG